MIASPADSAGDQFVHKFPIRDVKSLRQLTLDDVVVLEEPNLTEKNYVERVSEEEAVVLES